MEYGFYAVQRLDENRSYWASNFVVSSNGRLNVNYPPMEVVSVDAKLRAVGDSKLETKFNKLSPSSQFDIPVFDTQAEAQVHYLNCLRVGQNMLNAIKEKMDKASEYIESEENKLNSVGIKFESPEFLEHALTVGAYFFYNGEQLRVSDVNSDRQELKVENKNRDERIISYSKLLK